MAIPPSSSNTAGLSLSAATDAMDPNPDITVASRGETWPSGRSKPVAQLNINDAWLAAIANAPLASGIEPGLGPWTGIGLRLPSGARIELLRYQFGGVHFELHADFGANARKVLEEFLTTTGLTIDAIRWRQTEI